MGLLSRLFRREAEKAASDLLHDALNNAINDGKKAEEKPAAPAQASAPAAEPAAAPAAEATPAGRSWGETMPAEPNQYNYGGSYIQYFEEIFREEFPAYTVETTHPRGMNSTVFTFKSGIRTSLIVELLSASSSAKKLRETCRKEGTPYLRYYYNYEGWWNTRSYVVERTRKALG